MCASFVCHLSSRAGETHLSSAHSGAARTRAQTCLSSRTQVDRVVGLCSDSQGHQRVKMFPLYSSSTLPLLFFLSAPRLCGASCGSELRPGPDNFVLDTAGSVKKGAALLATHAVPEPTYCEELCCQDPLCNLALLEPRAPDAKEETHTCVLFDCVHQNRFVCRFVNQAEYKTFIRLVVFQRFLQGPGETRTRGRTRTRPWISFFPQAPETPTGGIVSIIKSVCFLLYSHPNSQTLLSKLEPHVKKKKKQ